MSLFLIQVVTADTRSKKNVAKTKIVTQRKYELEKSIYDI